MGGMEKSKEMRRIGDKAPEQPKRKRKTLNLELRILETAVGDMKESSREVEER